MNPKKNNGKTINKLDEYFEMNKASLDTAGRVRVGQELPIPALESFLKKELKLPGGKLNVQQFPSGYSNLTYLLIFGDKKYVLRRPPHGAQIKSGHDMGREFKLLSGLYPTYKKVPKPILYSEDLSIIDAPFYIMERMEGIIFRGHTSIEEIPSKSELKSLSKSFLNTLVEIHQIDYGKVGLSSIGYPEGYAKRQVDGWTKRYLSSSTHSFDGIKKVYKWLEKNIPDSPDSTLIHNDFKYDNLMYSSDGSYDIKSILDWEMATIGDPLMDLGTSLGYWFHDSDPQFIKNFQMNISVYPGNLSRSELVALYSQKTAIDVSNIVFYYVFGVFKIAVIIQQIYYRYKQGLTTDKRFKDLDKAVKLYGDIGHQAIIKNTIDNLF